MADGFLGGRGVIVLGYVGNHAADPLAVRLGWAATRLVQRGQFKRVTHVEGYYGGRGKRPIIASSSLREGGVRVKEVDPLNPADWVAIDVPVWDEKKSMAFVMSQLGYGYDSRGALATVFLGSHNETRWFCNELIGASVGVVSPEVFGPAQFMALALSMPGARIVGTPGV